MWVMGKSHLRHMVYAFLDTIIFKDAVKFNNEPCTNSTIILGYASLNADFCVTFKTFP